MRPLANQPRHARLAIALAIASAVFAFGGCAITGSPPPPAPGMPQAWSEAAQSDTAAVTADWWSRFGSAQLATLVADALEANPDLAIASERVRQAEAQVRIAGASLFPSLNLGASTSRSESRADDGTRDSNSGTSVGFSASYELDLWQRNALGVSASEASLRASQFDRENVRLTLVAGVAGGYFQLLSLRGRLLIAQDNLAIAERVLKVVDARVRYGAVSALDLTRQQAAVLSQRAAIAPLELQQRQTLYALALLLGKQPEGFSVAGAGVGELALPQVGAGLPSALLTRRPDLAAAEAQLAAANANLQAARAALLPSIGLTGSAGMASKVLLNILNSPAATISLGASLLQPIFDGGRLRGQVEIAASRERELAENYRKAVLAALADVEGALAAGARSAEQAVLQQQVIEQARKALKLSEIRYREGVDDLLVMLDAQRTLFQAEDQAAQIRLAQLQASIALFKALGGGWRQE